MAAALHHDHQPFGAYRYAHTFYLSEEQALCYHDNQQSIFFTVTDKEQANIYRHAYQESAIVKTTLAQRMYQTGR
jgi:hypothetical protein